VHRVSEADCAAAHVTLGRPIHNTRIAILDGALQPVPIGVPGDLFIGGYGVARGYRGQPELTAERFSADPWASIGRARMYKTGDVARFSADGTVAFLGRSDHQVKVRGHRIELDEVEAAILRASAVREAVVSCVTDGRGDAALCAYVVARDEAFDPAVLRAHLGTILPAYMIPSAFVVLAALPLGPSGKVNRAALPAPAEIARVRTVSPRTPLEAAIAAIWRRVLEIDDIGVDDDFFEVGGHSLKATHIVFGVQQELGLNATLTDIFRFPSVAALAQALDARRPAAPSPGELALSNIDA
jgi:acyl carrier protein